MMRSRTPLRAVQVVCAAVGSLFVYLALPSGAAGPVGLQSATPIAHGQALSSAAPVLTFAGTMHNPAPLPMASNPDPTACVSDCELWSLKVATSSPFLVSIHNGNDSIDDGFDLSVYDPAGKQVASADGIGANGQAVAVHPTGDGTYTVAVTMTYAYDTTSHYLGEVRLMSGPSWSSVHCPSVKPCAVLPAFSIKAPSDVHIDGIPPVASTPLGFPIPVNLPTPNSCYADETARTGAQRCLRFTSEIDNVGQGLLQLEIPWITTSSGTPQSGFVPGECHALQIVTMSNGSERTRPAGTCQFHQAHMHFHYNDLVEYSLHKVTADGRTGAQVARSNKASFCLADDGYMGFGRRSPNGPRDYAGQPDCNIPSAAQIAAGDAWVHEGISPGWGDIYTWDTPDQYIDITNVKPGIYDIVTRGNPSGLLELAGPSKPCATTRIRLTATSVKTLSRDIPCS